MGKLTGGSRRGKDRVGCKECSTSGRRCSYGRDASVRLVNTLVGEQVSVLESYDVFGNVFKFGHHVRMRKVRPGPTPLHDVAD